nr:hypothetical protein CFP56_61026 [Quercus suber]
MIILLTNNTQGNSNIDATLLDSVLIVIFYLVHFFNCSILDYPFEYNIDSCAEFPLTEKCLAGTSIEERRQQNSSSKVNVPDDGGLQSESASTTNHPLILQL